MKIVKKYKMKIEKQKMYKKIHGKAI